MCNNGSLLPMKRPAEEETIIQVLDAHVMTAEVSNSILVSDLGLNSDIVLEERFKSDLVALK
jgi:hypothetical protein